MRGEERRADEAGVDPARVLEIASRHRASIVVGALVGLALGFAALGLRAPVYRATATLLLDQAGPTTGLLGDLAALTSAPRATSEIEILASRTIASEVTSEPRAGASAHALGLTTLVEDRALRPLANPLGSAERGLARAPRLGAAVTLPPDGSGPLELVVELPEPGRVRVAPAGLAAAVGLGDVAPVEVPFDGDVELELGGARVRLWSDGDLAGRSFTVRALARSDAVERVLAHTRVGETDRNSGVLRVELDDTDPVRAAATVNALCRAYLERNREQGEQRASQTLEFIRRQLDEQLEALADAEREVVALQQQSPQAVDVGETARALIEELSGIEVERVGARLMRAALGEALALLESGRIEALSRLGPELADPITATYVEGIARLSAEAEVLERSDAGEFKGLLQVRVLEARTESEVVALELAELRRIAARLEAGDRGGLASLVETTEPGRTDPLLDAYLEQWSTIDSDLRRLEAEFTGELPAIGRLREERARTEERVAELVDGRVAALEARAEQYASLLSQREGRVDAYPAAERERIARALQSLTARTTTHLESRLAGIDGREDALDAEVARVEAQLVQLPEDQRVVAEPMRRLEAHGEIVKLLLARQKEAEIARAATIASARFIDEAVPPRERTGPSLLVHLLLGALLGLASAVGLAALREVLDRGVFSAAELEDATGLSVFGAIPDFRRGPLRVRGAGPTFLALRDDPEGPIAEAYRALRSNLKFALHGDRELKTIAFTSCVQGEGKSVTNVDVALAFALAGKRVLLVDADMRRPKVHEYLDVPLEPGLSDVLRGALSWRECVRTGVAPGLDVIGAGPQPESPGDLLASERALDLVSEVREEYDLVLFDVPPVLAVADIDCFAARLDGIVLLCRSAKVTSAAAGEAARRLRRAGANLLGAVLNAAPAARKKGYGYGYGYDARSAA